MKNLGLVCVMLLMTITSLHAQNFKWGVKAGMNTSSISPNDLVITNNDDLQRFKLNVADAKYGLHLGAFMQIKTKGKFFIRPEIHINTTRTDYEIEDFSTTEPVKSLVTESYTNISMPVNIGLKLGPLRLQGGAVGAYHLAGKSDLSDYEGYEQNFSKMALGWQAGIGLDIWKLNFDLKYEGDFGNYAEHMQFFGNNVSFDEKEKQMKFAVGWTF